MFGRYYPAIKVTAPAQICEGDQVKLTAKGAHTYTWYPSGITGPEVKITLYSTTVFTVLGTTSHGQVISATRKVVVNNTPSIKISVLKPGAERGQALMAAEGADFYSWITGSHEDRIPVAAAAPEVYVVVGSYSNGCSSSASIVVGEPGAIPALHTDNILQRSPVSEDHPAELSVFPNPSAGDLRVTAMSEIFASLINDSGNVVAVIRLNESNGYSESINGLTPGVYHLMCQGRGGTRFARGLIVVNR